MKLTARVSAILTGLLAAVSFTVTYRGFAALRGIDDPTQYRDARGFALFWAFLGCVFLAIAVLSWTSLARKQD